MPDPAIRSASLHLSRSLARDVMHDPIVACEPSTRIADVASLMAKNGIHCVIVEGIAADQREREHFAWGVVSDVDLLHAVLRSDSSLTAAEIAGAAPLTVDADDNLVIVGAALAENGTSHAVVVDDDLPVGVVSTLDIALAAAD